MFPLLYEDEEYPVKVLLLTIHGAVMWRSFSLYFSNENARGHLSCGYPSLAKVRPVLQSRLIAIFCNKDSRSGLIGKLGHLYIWGMVVVEIWGHFLHPYLLNNKLPFLPLMLQSIYCSLGMVYSYIFQLCQIFLST
jgi:alpha-1,3-glucosyltransferase